MRLAFLFFTLFVSVRSSDLNTIKQIKIENLKKNYVGKSIEFVDYSNSSNIKGRLLDITETTFVVSSAGSRSVFDINNIPYFNLAPEAPDYIIASSVSLLSAVAGYLSLVILRPDPDKAIKSTVLIAGAVIGGYIGKVSFLRPIKVELNLKDMNVLYAK